MKYYKDNQTLLPIPWPRVQTRPYSFLTPLKALAIASIPLTSFTCHHTRPVSNSNKATPPPPPSHPSPRSWGNWNDIFAISFSISSRLKAVRIGGRLTFSFTFQWNIVRYRAAEAKSVAMVVGLEDGFLVRWRADPSRLNLHSLCDPAGSLDRFTRVSSSSLSLSTRRVVRRRSIYL